MALGAGLRFAVPEINNIKSDGWTQANGAAFFGPNGEMYRVAFMNEATTVTVPTGQIAFLETATAALNTSSTTRASLFLPFIVQTASALDLIAGVWASSARGGELGIVQVAGPIVATLTASAEASAQNAFFANAGASVTAWASAVATDVKATPHLGGVGKNWPGAQTAVSTVRLALIPADGWGFGGGA